MADGYLYIFRNEAHPNLLKIGYTERTPAERAQELSSNTGVPLSFKVERSWLVKDVESLERKVHDALDSKRVPEKEFFNVSLSDAIESVEHFLPDHPLILSVAQVSTSSQRTLLTARSEYLAGFNTLLGLARRELRIFDPDLSELEMNSSGRIETLTRFLRESRARRIYVALHDIEHVTKRCPRLIALMSSYTSALLIFQTHGEAAKVQDCFVLADGDHLVRRPVRTQARGVLVINDPKECQPMRERFEEIWEASLPTVSVNTTGL
jgi:hypothetical protein